MACHTIVDVIATNSSFNDVLSAPICDIVIK